MRGFVLPKYEYCKAHKFMHSRNLSLSFVSDTVVTGYTEVAEISAVLLAPGLTRLDVTRLGCGELWSGGVGWRLVVHINREQFGDMGSMNPNLHTPGPGKVTRRLCHHTEAVPSH